MGLGIFLTHGDFVGPALASPIGPPWRDDQNDHWERRAFFSLVALRLPGFGAVKGPVAPALSTLKRGVALQVASFVGFQRFSFAKVLFFWRGGGEASIVGVARAQVAKINFVVLLRELLVESLYKLKDFHRALTQK